MSRRVKEPSSFHFSRASEEAEVGSLSKTREKERWKSLSLVGGMMMDSSFLRAAEGQRTTDSSFLGDYLAVAEGQVTPTGSSFFAGAAADGHNIGFVSS